MTASLTPPYRYWAFISYSSKDVAHAKWLQQAIETYGIPAKLVEHDHCIPTGEPVPTRFHPTFRDRDELSASADLGQAIYESLCESRFLIVICSPNAAQSKWVNREVETFIELGRADRVFACIVDGEPNLAGALECFPPALKATEPLAADARPEGDGRPNAKLKLLAGMLDVSFDALKRRDDQRRIRRLRAVVAATTGAIALLSFLTIFAFQQRDAAEAAHGVAVAAQSTAVSERDARSTAEANAVAEARARATAQVVAEDQRDRARAGELATLGLVRQDDQIDLAFLLAAQAFRQYDSFDTRSGLLRLVNDNPNLAGLLHVRDEKIWRLALSPDARLAAAGTDRGTIRLWRLDGRLDGEKRLEAGTGAILGLAFSHDGATLAAARCTATHEAGFCEASEIQLWRTADGQALGTLSGLKTGSVQSLAFSPDDRLLAAGGGGAVGLWDVAAHTPYGAALQVGPGTVDSLAFSPDGQLLLSATRQVLPGVQSASSPFTYIGRAQLWNASDGSFGGQHQECPNPSEMSVAFTPEGTPLVACAVGSLIYVLDLKTGEFGVPLAGHSGGITALEFSADGRRVASGGCSRFKSNGLSCIQGEVRLWQLDQHSQIGEPLRGTTDYVSSIALSRDGQEVLAVANESTRNAVLVWDFAVAQPLGHRLGRLVASALAASADGRTLAFGSRDGSILLTGATGEPIRTLKRHEEAVTALRFSSDSKRLASGDAGGAVWVWEVGAERPLRGPLGTEGAGVADIAFSPDGAELIVASNGPAVRWWDLQTGVETGAPFTATVAGVLAVLSSAGDRLAVATCCTGPQLHLWDLGRQTLIASTLLGDGRQVHGLAFSPDGKWLATGGCSAAPTDFECIQGEVRLWHAATGQPAGVPLTDHTESVRALAFSPDSATLASVSEELDIILWDAATQHAFGRLSNGKTRVVQGGVRAVFSGDGKELMTAADDVMAWQTDPLEWQARACRMANRNLTPQEWITYVGADALQKTCPEWP